MWELRVWEWSVRDPHKEPPTHVFRAKMVTYPQGAGLIAVEYSDTDVMHFNAASAPVMMCRVVKVEDE